jgi:pSer/pThr/pTyr-binding forkhead associated (FHA) protein
MPDKDVPNSNGSPPAPGRRGLRFISGKYRGEEFPLEEGKTVTIGRSSDLDMVLVEEMVSRKHARIHLDGGTITIEDLESTNGTFVNGEKIHHARLREGDRILIGTSILKVVMLTGDSVLESAASVPRAVAERAAQRLRGPRAEEVPRMTGNLEEIPLPDLMQLFGTSRKNGVLVLNSEKRTGRIYLDQGNIRWAMIEGRPEVQPLETIYRMLGWTRGVFELDPPENRSFPEPLNAVVQEVLMEGFRRQDEFNVLRNKLPPMRSRLILRTPLEAPLHELKEEYHLELLQLALNSQNLEALIDRSKLSMIETAEIVLGLMGRGYLTAAP